jgi:CheY-like chemotaxis protein
MLGSGSILVVDDDRALARVLSEVLNARGFEVWTAYNGLQGYTCYLAHPAQWVVTDIQMPELNGIEMMRCIRAINPAVKAIYASGDEERFRDALEIEEQVFAAILLSKPFTSGDLIALISTKSIVEPQYGAPRISNKTIIKSRNSV